MPDLGIDVLFKGTNMLRLLQGLWVAMQISIVSILISKIGRASCRERV